MVHLDVHDPGDFLLERRVGRHDLDDSRKELTRRSPEDRFGETVLGAEVVVKQRLVDPRLSGDVLHAGAGRSVPDEHGVRGVENPPSVSPSLAVGRSRCPADVPRLDGLLASFGRRFACFKRRVMISD